jgi:hypothetical protein
MSDANDRSKKTVAGTRFGIERKRRSLSATDQHSRDEEQPANSRLPGSPQCSLWTKTMLFPTTNRSTATRWIPFPF